VQTSASLGARSPLLVFRNVLLEINVRVLCQSMRCRDSTSLGFPFGLAAISDGLAPSPQKNTQHPRATFEAAAGRLLVHPRLARRRRRPRELSLCPSPRNHGSNSAKRWNPVLYSRVLSLKPHSNSPASRRSRTRSSATLAQPLSAPRKLCFGSTDAWVGDRMFVDVACARWLLLRCINKCPGQFDYPMLAYKASRHRLQTSNNWQHKAVDSQRYISP
jgi:hypothetical protein